MFLQIFKRARAPSTSHFRSRQFSLSLLLPFKWLPAKSFLIWCSGAERSVQFSMCTIWLCILNFILNYIHVFGLFSSVFFTRSQKWSRKLLILLSGGDSNPVRIFARQLCVLFISQRLHRTLSNNNSISSSDGRASESKHEELILSGDMIQDIDSIIIEQTRPDTKIWKQFIECLCDATEKSK